MSDPVLAVIDIGSNSIKLLVATSGPSGNGSTPRVLFQKSLETRISGGIGGEKSKLSDAGIEVGVNAVAKLIDLAKPYAPTHCNIVATSAVRDAANRADFAARIHAATGVAIEILSGEDEALLIARGIQTDPALRGVKEFCIIDLGGGSLECIRYATGKIEQAVSLQLGAVRLTEKFVPNPRGPFGETARHAIAEETRRVFAAGGFQFIPGGLVVGTGGAFAVARAILPCRSFFAKLTARRRRWHRKALAQQPDGFLDIEKLPVLLYRPDLAALLDEITPLEAAARAQIPGLTPERADIMPAALTTILTLLEIAQADRVLHSFHNLRFGIAARFFAQHLEDR